MGCRGVRELAAGGGLSGEGGVDVVAFSAVEEGGEAGEDVESVEKGVSGEEGRRGFLGEEFGVGYYRRPGSRFLLSGPFGLLRLEVRLLVVRSDEKRWAGGKDERRRVLWLLGGLLGRGETQSRRLLGPSSVRSRPSSPGGSP